MPALAKPIHRFGRFELEPAERRLSEAGRAAIALTPDVFDTLVLRAGHAGRDEEPMSERGQRADSRASLMLSSPATAWPRSPAGHPGLS